MRARTIGVFLGVAAVALLSSGPAGAAAGPGWSFDSVAVPTNFTPGSGAEDSFQVTAVNIGAAATDGSPIALADTLPTGVEVSRVELQLNAPTGVADFGPTLCEVDESGAAAAVTCAIPPLVAGAASPTILRPGESLVLVVYVKTLPGAVGPLENQVSIEGGGLAPASAVGHNEASTAPTAPGLSLFESAAVGEDGLPMTQAAGHPFQYVTTYAVDTEPGPETGAPFLPAGGSVKDIEVTLPPGLVGNATALPTCARSEFIQQRTVTRPSGIGQNLRNACPTASVVGFIFIRQLEGEISGLREPIYNLEAPLGMPAQFGFQLAGTPFYIDTKVLTDDEYRVVAYLPNLAEVKRASSATVIFWGVPGAAAHDALRGDCLNESPSGTEGISAGLCPASVTPRPFLTNSTACAGPQLAGFAFDAWQAPGAFLGADDAAAANTGCGSVPFEATLSARPQTTVADSPTGLGVDIHVEQHEAAAGVTAAHLRDAVVALPPGLTVNPSSAVGLGSCSPTQAGLTSAVGSGEATFDAAPATCPEASKLGTVEIDTPLLDHPIEGSVYLASQGQNPFGSLLALYIAADDARSGVVLKLAGRVEADPTDGRLTARFVDNPQLPFEDLRVHFFEGPAAPLRTPTTCGTYTTTSDLRPWSAPQSGPDATPSDTFVVSAAPDGTPCAASEAGQPDTPSFEAGTESPLAATFSPFVLKVSRGDGSQQLRRLDLNLPHGLLGRLAGIPYCPDAALAAAERTSGREETRSPSCPAASEVGTVSVGAGSGPRPLSVAGTAYLAGPYQGAPLSIAIVTPAVAGPFDLGTVVVRAAISIDPITTQLSVRSDPIPTILQGIPLDLRWIALRLARRDFILNPTSCATMASTGTAISPTGAEAPLSDRFGVSGCKELAFSPTLSLRLSGGTSRGKDPALRAVLTQPAGQANPRRVAVTLPRSLFIDQRHVSNPCTRVQYAAGECPPSSVLGHARAFTPLLDEPLEGPVYFRSNGGERKLPDLVADLNGQIHVDLVGYIDSVKAKGREATRVRTTFAQVPDAPVTRFVLELDGNKRGLLQNSANLCRSPNSAAISMSGQNGAARGSKAKIKVACHAHHRAHRRH
jgi:hypothetical protein